MDVARENNRHCHHSLAAAAGPTRLPGTKSSRSHSVAVAAATIELMKAIPPRRDGRNNGQGQESGMKKSHNFQINLSFSKGQEQEAED